MSEVGGWEHGCPECMFIRIRELEAEVKRANEQRLFEVNLRYREQTRAEKAIAALDIEHQEVIEQKARVAELEAELAERPVVEHRGYWKTRAEKAEARVVELEIEAGRRSVSPKAHSELLAAYKKACVRVAELETRIRMHGPKWILEAREREDAE